MTTAAAMAIAENTYSSRTTKIARSKPISIAA
jgi:hypothetical protein